MRRLFAASVLWVAAAVTVMAMPTAASAGAGSPDGRFDGDGIVTTAIAGQSTFGGQHGVGIQADGKIVVGGYTTTGSNADFVLVRYNSDGTLDASFDGDGVAVTPVLSSDDRGVGLAIQPDGKIVVAGSTYDPVVTATDFAVLRYDSDGTLDTTFDTDGKVVTPIGVGGDDGSGVAIQTDGKLVVSGGTCGVTCDLALVRYDADGSLDPGFDGDGKVVTSVPMMSGFGADIAIQEDNRILVAGVECGPGSCDVALFRYNTDGTLDASFDGDGMVVASAGGFDDRGYAIALQPDGKIVVAGATLTAFGDRPMVMRFNSDGSPDATFDGDGLFVGAVGLGLVSGMDLVIQPGGKILVAGTGPRPAAATLELAALRLNGDGTVDTAFGYNGAGTAGTGDEETGFAIALQSDNEIILSGWSINFVSTDLAVARLDGAECVYKPGCLAMAKSSLSIRSVPGDEDKDKLQWKGGGGPALSLAELGDPLSGTTYEVCVFAGGANTLVSAATLLAGPGWGTSGTSGYKFKGSSFGLTGAKVKAGSAGKSKAQVKGAGAELPNPTLPLSYPVTVQFQRPGSPLCLQSTFTSADEKKNDSAQFKAKH